MTFFDKIMDFFGLSIDEPIEKEEFSGFTITDSDNDFKIDAKENQENYLDDVNKRECKGFKYLDILVHSGEKEIYLDSDIVLDDDEESVYSDGIKLNVDNLIINGNGHIINARRKTRIFTIFGKNIVFKDLYFKNGYAERIGGALYIKGRSDIEILNCCFYNNKTFHKGGAIYSEGKVKIENSRFEDNLAKDFGGAIRVARGIMTINSSEFIGNNVDGYGGALSNESKVVITNSLFEDNTTNNCAGVIHNLFGKRLKISNTSFIKNSGCRGQIIEPQKSLSMSLKNCVFEGNIPEFKK